MVGFLDALKSLATPDNLYLLGAGLKDVGNQGETDNLGDAQKVMIARKAKAQQDQARASLLAALGGGGMIGGLAGDPNGGAGGAQGGQLPSLARMAPSLLAANLAGVPGVDGIASILKGAEPSVKIGPDGTPYNENDPSVLGKHFANRTVLGDQLVDANDAANTNRVASKSPVAGAIPAGFDAQGNITSWMMPSATANAIRDASAAETAGRTGSTLYKVPRGDGSEAFMTGGQFLGGGGGSPGGGATPAGPALGVTQNPADATYGNDMAKSAAAQYETMQKAGMAATGKLAKMQQIDALLGNYEGGKFAPAGLELASAANSLGFKMDAKMSNAQAADAISKQLALEMRDPSGGAGMPGALSNSDRDYLAKTVPGLLQSSGGRRQLVQINSATYKRQADVANMARQWQQRFGRIDKPDASGKTFQDYLQVYSEKNPLFKQ